MFEIMDWVGRRVLMIVHGIHDLLRRSRFFNQSVNRSIVLGSGSMVDIHSDLDQKTEDPKLWTERETDRQKKSTQKKHTKSFNDPRFLPNIY